MRRCVACASGLFAAAMNSSASIPIGQAIARIVRPPTVTVSSSPIVPPIWCVT